MKTIQKSFAHCGFKHSDLEMLNKADNGNCVVLEMHHLRNYDEFSYTDNSFQCYNENEDCEEATVEQEAAKQQKASEDQETEKDDTTKCERVTNQNARKCIAGLRHYFK